MSTSSVRPAREAKRKATYEEPPDIEAEVYTPIVKKRKVVVTGRSGSAPPMGKDVNGKNTLIYQPGGTMPAFHSYVEDISMDTDWNDTSKKGIRLAYKGLDPGKPSQMQGLFIEDPAITGHTGSELPKHLEKVKTDMLANIKKTSATEATGEAAAAFAMCKEPEYSGFVMKWGAHLHSGAGLDQIWHKPTPGDPEHPNGIYMIVEAKGVDATTSNTRFGPPPDIQQQMSIGWIGHNVATMIRNEHKPAIQLASDVGMEEELKGGKPYYAGYGGASKNYYKCRFQAKKRKALLKGLVVQAGWTPAGGFTYGLTEYDYGNISGSK